MDEVSVGTSLVPEIMPAETVAEVLGVTEQELEALSEAGLAPGVRIVTGGPLLFEYEALLGWIRRLCIAGLNHGQMRLFPE